MPLEAAGSRRTAPAQDPVENIVEEAMPNAETSTAAGISPPTASTGMANVIEEENMGPAGSPEPSTRLGTPSPSSDQLETSAPGASRSEQVDEVPVGLIKDDLLGADLCNDMLNSLRQVYKHHKVIP